MSTFYWSAPEHKEGNRTKLPGTTSLYLLYVSWSHYHRLPYIYVLKCNTEDKLWKRQLIINNHSGVSVGISYCPVRNKSYHHPQLTLNWLHTVRSLTQNCLQYCIKDSWQQKRVLLDTMKKLHEMIQFNDEIRHRFSNKHATKQRRQWMEKSRTQNLVETFSLGHLKISVTLKESRSTFRFTVSGRINHLELIINPMSCYAPNPTSWLNFILKFKINLNNQTGYSLCLLQSALTEKNWWLINSEGINKSTIYSITALFWRSEIHSLRRLRHTGVRAPSYTVYHQGIFMAH